MRKVGSSGVKTVEALLREATRLICEHGYEVVSLRQLAEAVGLQAGSIYNYFKSKQDILLCIMNNHLDDLNSRLKAALEGVSDPTDRLAAFTRLFVTYHYPVRQTLFVSTTELRSLSDGNRELIMRKRHEFSQILRDIIDDGMESGDFVRRDSAVTASSILWMLTGINFSLTPTDKVRGRACDADRENDLTRTYEDIVLAAVLDPEVVLRRRKSPRLTASAGAKRSRGLSV